MEDDVVYAIEIKDKENNTVYYTYPIRTFDFVYKAFKDFKI